MTMSPNHIAERPWPREVDIGMVDRAGTPFALGWLLERVDPSLYNRTDTRESLLAAAVGGRLQVWVCKVDSECVGVFTTQIDEYPRGRVLQITLLAGKGLEESLDVGLSKLERFAADVGCSRVQIVGRKGWERLLRARGWRFASVVMDKVVRRGQNGR